MQQLHLCAVIPDTTGQVTIQEQSCSSQETFKYSSLCLNSSVLHWASSCGQSCSNIVQYIWPATECNLSVSTVWVCEWEVRSVWSWTAWIAFVKDSSKGRKWPSWDLRCSNVQPAVDAWSWPIITNNWHSLSHHEVSIPTLTAGGNLQCQIMLHDQTSALHGTYNSLCWAMHNNEVLTMDFARVVKQVERMCKPAAVDSD